MLWWEIHQAYDEARQRGLPRLLPVRVAFAKPLPQELGAILDRLPYHFVWLGPQDDERPGGRADTSAAWYQADETAAANRLPRRRSPPGCPVVRAASFRSGRPRGHRSSRQYCPGPRGAPDGQDVTPGSRPPAPRRTGCGSLSPTSSGSTSRSWNRWRPFTRPWGPVSPRRIELDVLLEEVWKPALPPNTNFQAYVRDRVLAASDAPLVWAMDEVDRLFNSPFGTEVFALFRSWHNARTMPPAKFADSGNARRSALPMPPRRISSSATSTSLLSTWGRRSP